MAGTRGLNCGPSTSSRQRARGVTTLRVSFALLHALQKTTSCQPDIVGAPACTIRSFRAEDTLEIGIHARDDLARDIGVRDCRVAVDERALPSAELLRRHSNAAGALDQFV